MLNSKSFLPSLALFVTIGGYLCLLLALPVARAYDNLFGPLAVKSAGTVVLMRQVHQGRWRTLVETDSGTWLIGGQVSLLPGDPLVLKDGISGSQLCKKETAQCGRVDN